MPEESLAKPSMEELENDEDYLIALLFRCSSMKERYRVHVALDQVRAAMEELEKRTSLTFFKEL